MKFGVLQFFSWPQRSVALRTVFDRALDRITVMDEAGYDAVWLAEHHFTGYSVCPSVHMMGVAAAARTERLRIGTGVSLAALYHPLRLAEEVALLDVLSGGRVNWGAGRGFDPVEFAAFGVPLEESGERFHEAVQAVEAAWRSDRLTWHGKHWDFNGVEVLPKPAQRPHPPIWLAAGSDGAVRWAGRRGYSIMLGPHATFSETAAHQTLYRQALEGGGHRPAPRDLPIARMVVVARSRAEARDVARSGLAWIADAYINRSKVSDARQSGQAFMLMEREQLLTRYLDEVVIHGTADDVVASIERLRRDIGLDYLLCVPLSHESFVAFTEQVLPVF